MNEGKDGRKDAAADLEDLARRFQDLWRDQMAATAADPEFIEMMRKWMALFSGGGGQAPAAPPGMFPGMPGVPGLPADPAAWMASLQAAMAGAAVKGGANDGTTGAAPAGTASAAHATGAGHVAGDELEHRLAALERRMDRLEAAIGGARGGPAKRTRARKS
jgi:hypothetical protein